MANSDRSVQDARDAFKGITNAHYYDKWADTYITDHNMMEYTGPVATAEALMKHLTQSPDQVRVLDVACGTGFVAQQLSSLGFRQFVGVDGSQPMLDKARLTGLYQDLHLVLLGTQPLPQDLGEYDVVTMVGALQQKYVPVSVVRELCQAAKPGGLVVMTRANYKTTFTEEYLRELVRMEEEGLWKQLEVVKLERYLADFHNPGSWICGSVYVYKKL